MRHLLGLDAGTTNFKAALYDESGGLVARHSEEYLLSTPAPDRVEMEPEEYWRICCRAITGVLGRAGVRGSSVAALAISSQGETLISVDAEGAPLGRAIVWLDNRSRREAQVLASDLGVQHAYEVTGQPEISATWPATKILWLKRNMPAQFDRTARFLLLEDFLILRLTGIIAGERSLHSSTMLLDIRSGSAWGEMLDRLGIDGGRLPPLLESGVVVGPVRACAETGLSPDTLVVTGALDQAAGMIGSGSIRAGMVTESTGTCLAVCVNTGDAFTAAPGSRIPQHYGVLPRSYYSLLWSPTAGIVLKWFRDAFFLPAPPAAAAADGLFDAMIAEAMRVPPGSDGLVMSPHFCGSAFPDFDSNARGVFSGITLAHTRGHFVRAILESVAFLLRQAVEAIQAQGVAVTEIRSIGGGASSAAWSAIKADVTGTPIRPVGNPEPACLGAALLAGVGAGIFPSLAQACDSVVAPGEAVLPGATAAYQQAYMRFCSLTRGGNGNEHGTTE